MADHRAEKEPGGKKLMRVERCLRETIAVCPPAGRVLAVVAIASKEGAEESSVAFALRVVCMRVCRLRTYAAVSDDPFLMLPSTMHRDILKDGWELVRQEECFEAMVTPPAGSEHADFVTAEQAVGENGAYRIVTCNWPAREDEATLGAVKQEVREEALALARGQRQRRDA